MLDCGCRRHTLQHIYQQGLFAIITNLAWKNIFKQIARWNVLRGKPWKFVCKARVFHLQVAFGHEKRGKPKVCYRVYSEEAEEKKLEYRMQIAVNCKWPSAMKIMEQYLLVLYRHTISLQTRGFFNSNLGRVRIVLPDQPVLPDWELFLAKLTLLWKDDQFGDHKLCQFGRFAFHLLAGIDPTDHSSDKSYRSSFAMTKIIKIAVSRKRNFWTNIIESCLIDLFLFLVLEGNVVIRNRSTEYLDQFSVMYSPCQPFSYRLSNKHWFKNIIGQVLFLKGANYLKALQAINSYRGRLG